MSTRAGKHLWIDGPPGNPSVPIVAEAAGRGKAGAGAGGKRCKILRLHRLHSASVEMGTRAADGDLSL